MNLLFWFLSLSLAVASHRFSVLFTAQDVKDYLSTDGGIQWAIQWCQMGNISKVYLETYRDGYTADQNTLLNAKKQFEAANFTVKGCVCTTKIGKPSTGWDEVSCYSNTTTQQQVIQIFKYAASLFDEIIIDDFYFTDCECNECNASLASGKVVVNGQTTTFQNTTDLSCTEVSQCSYSDMRRTLMSSISQYDVLETAKAVNPAISMIIKYPNWYDSYQDKGYDTQVETSMFDKIWVGTESRNYDDPEFGGIPAYFGFFNMRWLGQVGGAKCGGGWYDTISTDANAYIEQARTTILGGAKESFLFEFGAFQTQNQAQVDMIALRQNMPELQSVAAQVQARDIMGVAAYKPTNSHGGCVQDPSAGGNTCSGEVHIFDFVGMLGIPIVPTSQFPTNEAVAFFSIQALKDSSLTNKLTQFISTGRITLVTDGLANIINQSVPLNSSNVFILKVNGNPGSLISNPPDDLPLIRDAVLKPLGWQFRPPSVNISLFPFSDGSWVIENFRNNEVLVELNGQTVPVSSRGWSYYWA